MNRIQQYEAIDLSSIEDMKSYTVNENGESSTSLKGLSRLNFFIGPNNSGKSRFMRALVRAKKYRYRATHFDLSKLRQIATDLQSAVKTCFPQGVLAIGSIDPNLLAEFLSIDWLEFQGAEQKPLKILARFRGIVTMFVEENSTRSVRHTANYANSPQIIASSLKQINNFSQKALSELDEFVEEIGQEERVYIPILRGLRPVAENGSDVYKDRTLKDYDLRDSCLVFTGLDLYNTVRDHLLGERKKRKLIDDYQKFLSKEFFDNQAIELIPRHEGDVLHIKIGNDDELPLYKLGDGIQSLIILTFIPFIADSRNIFFIEEPDIYLHPGMQRKLVEIISAHPKFAKHQFFLTTHSNHLLDLTMDYLEISIFLFKKNNETFFISPVGIGSRHILHEIGARSSSVFLTNASIWVEGITDRLYIREFLIKYMKDNEFELPLREDTHFSIIELGGGNLVHFNFDELADDITDKINTIKVCSNSFVILDGDNGNKSKRVSGLKAILQENIYLLEGKEIENVIPESLLLESINRLLRSSSKFKDKRLAKQDIVASEYQGKDVGVGRYLDEKLGIAYFSSDSGTVKSRLKILLCNTVREIIVENEIEWSLSHDAEELCRKLAGFIQKENS